ncbi:hypothetical protein [Pontitalea aquivivens]|uniref:hypothetical protein n=1 Tax=Pontitalea aquivivens TaxID=3388663 RepID=UPI00397113E1
MMENHKPRFFMKLRLRRLRAGRALAPMITVWQKCEATERGVVPVEAVSAFVAGRRPVFGRS